MLDLHDDKTYSRQDMWYEDAMSVCYDIINDAQKKCKVIKGIDVMYSVKIKTPQTFFKLHTHSVHTQRSVLK